MTNRGLGVVLVAGAILLLTGCDKEEHMYTVPTSSAPVPSAESTGPATPLPTPPPLVAPTPAPAPGGPNGAQGSPQQGTATTTVTETTTVTQTTTVTRDY